MYVTLKGLNKLLHKSQYTRSERKSFWETLDFRCGFALVPTMHPFDLLTGCVRLVGGGGFDHRKVLRLRDNLSFWIWGGGYNCQGGYTLRVGVPELPKILTQLSCCFHSVGVL
jgi:hypothetical protein